jgi:hypothetical protein
MTEEEFWESTPAFFSFRQKAHAEKFRNEWEQTRYISKNKLKRPSQLLPFDWDAKPDLKKLDEFTEAERAEFDKFDAEADEILKRTNPEMYAKHMAAKAAAQKT